jgi:hypothetical protein
MDAAAQRAAQATLTSLQGQLGQDGLLAAASIPALLANIDQHAAAVRDTLATGEETPGMVALAGYADGLCDAAAQHGWQPPIGKADWSGADWPLVRLMAVCALASDAGYV